MKRMLKLWDLLLVAIIGIVGSGCILDPIPEYGVEPLYGVPAVSQDTETEHQEEIPAEPQK